LLVLWLAACQGHHQRPPCPPGQSCVLIGNGAEPNTLDPAKLDGTWEYNIVSQLIQGLADRNPAGEPIPGIAKSWTTSADGLTWTFKLRDAVWSDGIAVTADDFVYGMRREMDPKTASYSAFINYPIKNAAAVNAGRLPLSALGVSAPDPHTVVITLEHPWPMLPYLAAGRTFWPAPRRAVERWGDGWTQPGRFIGDGPYTLVSWRLGDRVVVQKNPRFWDAKDVCIDQVAYYPGSDAVGAERAVRAGELDVSTVVQSNRLAYLRRTGLGSYLRTAPFAGVVYLVFNLKDTPALRDARVRQALSMSIDREFIARKLLRGGQTPAYGFVPQTPDYPSGVRAVWADWSFPRRLAAARRLLAEAGYGPGHRLKLTITFRNSADPLLFMPAIQADWRPLGVDAALRVNDVQVAYEAYETHDFEVGDAGWVADEGMNYFELDRSDTGGQNYGQYANPAYDAELDAANRDPDPAARAAHMRRAEAILLADTPVAPIYFLASRNLVSPRLTGWVDNRADVHLARWLCWRGQGRRVAEAR
jgi:oligopeptide transport system substrate-binding protein